MSLTLLIALVASVPFAGLCWLCAAGIDRFGSGVRLRVAGQHVAFQTHIHNAHPSHLGSLVGHRPI